MKYVLMFADRPEVSSAVPPERQQEVYNAIYGWFQENAAVIADMGVQLQPASTATTVRSGGDGTDPVVVDGPFLETKEQIGGFSVIEVPDLDAALAVARTWPGLAIDGVSVEVRPMVE
ncbi:YCII-related protein [Beutenbergia cavernae DSM 12333]|uniref:YCII-related protein n=1 Tax=Beutenbergia cavernae (strain ATCC BAA-8 / DSM 12333 / CCUG 43141 / JCM 11478 / NBRC 16432 / NCIMB 13614 / HKI 0122) TaxID=471853 RepID=C5C3B0_BEUC1|nr:YciI family protein [Beutenbergia cavernae]ACQ79809.1 YCII-related protein [Beutenbergia cavernae DSM 12333]